MVGLGCNNFGRRLDAGATAQVVDAALDAGIDFFDTADVYGDGHSEEFLGRALGARRGKVVVATKFGMRVDADRGGAHPTYIRRAVEDSLRRLGTDYIDLYQLHQPDPTVPIADTLGALDQLVREGLVREIGCSNLDAAQLAQAAGAAAASGGAGFASVQNHYSLLHREPEAEVLAECARLGLAFIPYFPLASGLLTGKYRAGQAVPGGTRLANSPRRAEQLSPERLARAEALLELAAASGHSLLELAFTWLLARPEVASVIAGATRPEQVRANVASAQGDWVLSADDRAAINRIAPRG